MNALFAALYTQVLWPAQNRVESIRREDGLEAVEYALIAALVAAGIVVAVTALRTQIIAVFDNLTQQMSGTN